jgi:NAD(P)H-hydrate epimerase
MQALDRLATTQCGIPSLLLMENAGRVVAKAVLRFKPRRVVLACGSGNNGGDGFVAARHLVNHGVRCTVIYVQRPADADPALNFSILKKMRVPCVAWRRFSPARRQALLRRADVIVDALFGTGLSRPVREPYTAAIEAINRSGATVVSVDLPSGMHADTGAPLGACVRATRTVTLALPKRAFKHKASRRYTGRVTVADISIPTHILFPMV